MLERDTHDLHRRGFPLSISSLVTHPSINLDIYRTYFEMGDTAIDISRTFIIIGVFRNKQIILNDNNYTIKKIFRNYRRSEHGS
jgi:hypothetical protein